MKSITWTHKKREQLRAAIIREQQRNTNPTDTFTFDGQVFVLGHAEYLLQYLDQQQTKPEPRRTYARSRGGR